jgi:glycine/D-amino acid oxidase-like deaminating enzyme
MMRSAQDVLCDVDENRSVWVAGKPAYTAQPALAGDTTCDLAIVGGGFCGVSTARHFSERFPNLAIAIFEARELANGASGRNGGLMLNWITGVETSDPEKAKLVFDATKEGIDDICRHIADHRLDVSHRRDGTLEVLTDPARAEMAARDVERLRRAGIPLEFLAGERVLERLGLQGAYGAVFDPTCGQLDGVSYLRAQRPYLLDRGVRVYENTPVLAIREGKTIEIETAGGTAKAKAVVLATNAYTPSLGYFKEGIVPVHSHAIATERLSLEAWRDIGWRDAAGFSDDLDRIAYGSLTNDGALVFGGGSNAAYSYAYGSSPRFTGDATKNFEAVRQRLIKYFPRAKDVGIAHKWTGAVALTMSRVPTMGVTGEHRNVYYAIGFSGHGIVLANMAGRVLCDIYADDDARWRALPFYMQKLLYVPPEPLRWMGYHFYTTVTGKSPRRAG